jgi:pimeloyl-ACP methyl ester carboxylesterase
VALLKVQEGRRVHYEVSGQVRRGDTVLVFHHGSPGAAITWNGIVDAAAAMGWAVVALSRPGYAGSTRLEGRRVADAAGDVAAVLDHLGAGSFSCAGWSGGGPHALATAALLKDRCIGVATLAGVAPWGADGLDWLASMGQENVEEFGLVVAGGGEPLRAALQAGRDAMLAGGPAGLAEAIAGLLSEPDREVMEEGVDSWLFQMFEAAVVDGVDGWYDDDMAFLSDWGFDLGSLSDLPVQVWYGTADYMVPPAHGAWLAEHIPSARATRLDGEGHLSLLARHASAVIAELAALARR